MLKYSLPLMATGLLQVFYNAADMIVVGRFAGDFAMGAVGACGSLINLLVNAFIGLSVGTSICVAQSIGAKNDEKTCKLVNTSLLLGIIFGLLVGFFGFFMSGPLLRMMGTPENVLIEAIPYMKAYFVGIPASLIYNFLAAALRSSGDTKRPLIFLATSGIVNVVLNLIMVLVFHMGAVGVGIATSAAQYTSAIMIFVYMIRMDGPCRIDFKRLRMYKKELFDIISTGIPAGISSVVFSVSNVLIQSSVNAYGDIVVSGNTAAGNIESFIYVAMNSIYQATLTFVGQHVGAGKIERIKKITVMSLLIVVLVGLFIGILAYGFHDALLEIYKPGDGEMEIAIREAGATRMKIISTTYFLCGVMEVLGGVMRGMGKSLQPMIVSIFGSCLLRIVWIFAVCQIFPGRIEVLYLAWPITWVITSLGHLCCCIVAYKRMLRSRRADQTVVISKQKESVTA